MVGGNVWMGYLYGHRVTPRNRFGASERGVSPTGFGSHKRLRLSPSGVFVYGGFFQSIFVSQNRFLVTESVGVFFRHR